MFNIHSIISNKLALKVKKSKIYGSVHDFEMVILKMIMWHLKDDFEIDYLKWHPNDSETKDYLKIMI